MKRSAFVLALAACTAPAAGPGTPADAAGDTAGGTDRPAATGALEEGGVVVCADPSRRDGAKLEAPPDAGDFVPSQPGGSAELPSGWGVSVADFDGDGHLDVLLPQPGPPQLFFGDGTGRLSLRADAFPGADATYAHGSSAADADGDGDLDVLLARLGPDVLWLNDGAGRFTDGTAAAGLGADPYTGMHAAWGDYDGDRDLDVLVVNRLNPADEDDGTQGEPNALWENLGDGTFADRSALLTWRDLSIGFSYMAGWWDLDGDLRPELYVVNDKGHSGWANALARWDGEAFQDIAEGSGLQLAIRGMGLGASELNGDGVPDFLVTDWGELWLLLSDGAGGWYDATLTHGLDLPPDPEQSVAWGAELEDLDNDGDADLVVAFGNDDLFRPTPGRDYESAILQYDAIWLQDESGQFVPAGDDWPLGAAGMGRGFALADIDGNGWLDLVRRDLFGVARYQTAPCGAEGWVQVALAGPPPNTRGVGARVEVEAGGRRWTRWIHAGSTNLASSAPPVVHVGLGELDVVDVLRVVWPDGGEQTFGEVPARQRVTVRRDAPG